MRRIWRLVHYVRPYALYSLAHQFSVPDQRNAHIGVQTEGGTTSLANDPDFQIGYPDATITSILPTLTAGQITTVTITGTNLGDVPQIFVNDPANGVRIVGAPFQASADHTSIQVNVEVDAVVSPELATFTLYPEYSAYGSGFVSGNPGGVDGAATGADKVLPAPTTPSITISFGGNKNPSDHLMFLTANNYCTELLGLASCLSNWHWNLERKIDVNDDAANWKVTTYASGFFDYYYKDLTGALQHALFPYPAMTPDTPDPPFLQDTPGTRNIFFLDAPGVEKQAGLPGYQPIDSGKYAINFTGSVCSTINTTICANASWYIELQSNPGGLLDTSYSSAGLGTAP